MNWLPVTTLPDGTIIEMPMPSPSDPDQDGVHGYRVRGSQGVTVFSTLPEVINYLQDQGDPQLKALR